MCSSRWLEGSEIYELLGHLTSASTITCFAKCIASKPWLGRGGLYGPYSLQFLWICFHFFWKQRVGLASIQKDDPLFFKEGYHWYSSCSMFLICILHIRKYAHINLYIALFQGSYDFFVMITSTYIFKKKKRISFTKKFHLDAWHLPTGVQTHILSALSGGFLGSDLHSCGHAQLALHRSSGSTSTHRLPASSRRSGERRDERWEPGDLAQENVV